MNPARHIANSLADSSLDGLDFKKKIIITKGIALGYKIEDFVHMFAKEHNVAHGTYSVAAFIDDSAGPSSTVSAAQRKKDDNRHSVRRVTHFGNRHHTIYMSDGTTINVYEDGYIPPAGYVKDVQQKTQNGNDNTSTN